MHFRPCTIDHLNKAHRVSSVKYCFKSLSLFARWRRRSAVCFTRTKHCPGSRHVCTTGAALHRAAQRYSCRYTHCNLYKYWISYIIQSCGSTLVQFRYFENKVNITIRVFSLISDEQLKDKNYRTVPKHTSVFNQLCLPSITYYSYLENILLFG